MLDSQIAEQLIANGGVVSNGEFVYLPLRLTGTGTTERIDQNGLAYLIDRKLEDFGNEEWMKQYANIPILLTHPKDDEGNPIRADLENGCFVGNTIASFIKGNEIWVIGKLFDKDTFELLMQRAEQELPISTSPHFVSDNKKQEDSEIYVEVPIKINHLAIVERGFWDKKSTQPSIDLGNGEITLIQGVSMEEEQKQEKSDSIMEQSVTSTPKEEEKSDSNGEGVEQRLTNLEEHEAKEAKSFEELANEHKNLEKGDEMGIDKRELIREIMAISGKPVEEFEGGEDEKVETISKLAEQLAYNPSESGKSDEEPKVGEAPKVEENKADEEPKAEDKQDNEPKEEEDKTDSLVTGDYCDEDVRRDSVLKKMHSLSDYAKVPYVSGRVKAWKAQKEFAKSNLDLVDEKYLGMVDKIDSSMSSLTNEMFDSMVAKIEAKRANDMKNAGSNSMSFFSGKFKNR